MTSHKTIGALSKTIGIILLISLSLSAHAKQKRFLYSSLKTGSYIVNIPDYKETGTPLGIQLGYDYGSDWALELEFLHDTFTVEKQGLSSDVALHMWGLYSTYRYPSKLYYLVRFGMTNKEIEDPGNGTATHFDDLEWAVGLGGGFRFNGKYSVEIEYTRSKADVALVGLQFRRYFDFHGSKYK